jgi:hypothetical protein
MHLPFALSNAVLVCVQAGLVGAVRPGAFPALARLKGRGWALVPVGSIVGTVFGIQAVAGSASALTVLALVAVPPLAAVGVGYAARGSRWTLAPAAAPLFALAWGDRTGLVGEAAALLLSAGACITLAGGLAALTPIRWLKAGVLTMAVADAALVISDQLRAPNDALNAAAPPIGLPQLQEAQFGSAVMGFGDLFIAAVVGAIVAQEAWSPRRATLVAVVLAGVFDLLFLLVDELPATVPMAATLLVLQGCKTAPERHYARVAADS